MGVYINMEMPQNHNYVTITIWSNGAANYALHARGESLVDFRNVDVVPVPPHGRLIDADANLAVMRQVLNNPYTDHGKIDTAMIKACITMFEEAPTIIPAEEGE